MNVNLVNLLDQLTLSSSVIARVQEYRLTYRVFDDKYASTTTVRVEILDVNDNPPRFDNAIYNVTDVVEEESGISKNNPKYLLTVIVVTCFCSFSYES